MCNSYAAILGTSSQSVSPNPPPLLLCVQPPAARVGTGPCPLWAARLRAPSLRLQPPQTAAPSLGPTSQPTCRGRQKTVSDESLPPAERRSPASLCFIFILCTTCPINHPSTSPIPVYFLLEVSVISRFKYCNNNDINISS